MAFYFAKSNHRPGLPGDGAFWLSTSTDHALHIAHLTITFMAFKGTLITEISVLTSLLVLMNFCAVGRRTAEEAICDYQ